MCANNVDVVHVVEQIVFAEYRVKADVIVVVLRFFDDYMAVYNVPKRTREREIQK